MQGTCIAAVSKAPSASKQRPQMAQWDASRKICALEWSPSLPSDLLGNLPLLKVCSYIKTAIRKSWLGCQFILVKYSQEKNPNPRRQKRNNQFCSCQVHVSSAARLSRSGEEKTGLEVNFHRWSVARA